MTYLLLALLTLISPLYGSSANASASAASANLDSDKEAKLRAAAAEGLLFLARRPEPVQAEEDHYKAAMDELTSRRPKPAKVLEHCKKIAEPGQKLLILNQFFQDFKPTELEPNLAQIAVGTLGSASPRPFRLSRQWQAEIDLHQALYLSTLPPALPKSTSSASAAAAPVTNGAQTNNDGSNANTQVPAAAARASDKEEKRVAAHAAASPARPKPVSISVDPYALALKEVKRRRPKPSPGTVVAWCYRIHNTTEQRDVLEQLFQSFAPENLKDYSKPLLKEIYQRLPPSIIAELKVPIHWKALLEQLLTMPVPPASASAAAAPAANGAPTANDGDVVMAPRASEARK